MYTDPIADYLTRIRNGLQASHRIVEIPSGGLKRRITEILYDHGYILKYKFDDGLSGQGVIKIALKYDNATKQPVIKHLKRVSKPGKRVYKGSDDLPRVLNGLGIAIVSTSQGVMSNIEAKKKSIGGEVICEIY